MVTNGQIEVAPARPVPPLTPDPELVDNDEGNVKLRDQDRDALRAALEETGP
jgi:hypothetical protein